jgi:hypothetical protein
VAGDLQHVLLAAQVLQEARRTDPGLGTDRTHGQGRHSASGDDARHRGGHSVRTIGGVEESGHGVTPSRTGSRPRRSSTGECSPRSDKVVRVR